MPHPGRKTRDGRGETRVAGNAKITQTMTKQHNRVIFQIYLYGAT